jgi:hypothetical protein
VERAALSRIPSAGGGEISDLISIDFANDELGYLVTQ